VQYYIIRRLLQGVLVLIASSMIIFVVMRVLPSDPVLTRAGATNVWSEEMAREMRAKFGLDKPIHTQYIRWIAGALRGDFGVSYYNQFSVTELLQRKLGATIELAVAALLLSLIIAIPAGIFAAVRHNTWVDYLTSGFVAIGISIPSFWLGIILVIIFSVWLKVLPSSGYVPFFQDPLRNLQLLILPATTLAIILAAPTMRFLRSSLLEVLQQDYIRTARSKGLEERKVLYRHAMRNALIPTVTILGIIIGSLISGVVLVEWVFSWPGIGWLAVDSVFKRDYSVVQTVVLFITMMIVLVNLAVDLAYGFLDPRIRYN
jgi:peptide/nickel transport system permease protein